jgi:predicted DNA-binding transcriptional regulator AlpA
MPELPEVATARQVAELLGVPEASLAQDRYLRKGVPYIKIGKRVRYLRSDVLKYLTSHRFGGDAA